MFRFRLLIVAAIATLLSATSYGATVKGRSTKKGTVKIDEGNAAGFTKGQKVCFYSRKGKKVACGKVARGRKTSAVVRVSKKRIKRIRKGMEARLDGAVSTVVGQEEVSKDVDIDHRTNVRLGYILTALAPAVYNKLTYEAPADANEENKVSTLWKAEESATSSLIGVVLSGEFGVGSDMAVEVGMRYRFYRDFIATSDYNKSDLTKFVEVEQSGTALGLYSDYKFLDIPFSKKLFLRMGSGLDIDQSTVTFSATQKSDSGDTNSVADATSTLGVISLRLGSQLSFLVVGPLGLTFDVNLLVPVAGFGGSFSGKVPDEQATTLLEGGNGAKDLESALDHKQASFGAELILATYFAF